MALHQHVVRVVPSRDAGYGRRYGISTWDSGLADARLVATIGGLPAPVTVCHALGAPVAGPPATGKVVDALGVSVRARVDDGEVTVEVNGTGAAPVDVVVT